MENLLDLPNEILFKILSHVARECPKFVVHSLLTSSRRLSLLLRPLIIKDIRFHLDSDWYRPKARHALLMRTFNQNPELRDLVHSVAFVWKHGDINENVHKKANEILDGLSRLRSLYILADVQNVFVEGPSSLPTRFLEVNHLSDMREIKISDRWLPIDIMQKYMVLTPAENITFRAEYTESSSRIRTNRMSAVLNLDLKATGRVLPHLLREILGWCPRIRTLRWSNPAFNPNGDREVHILSPVGYSKALALTRDSLREFELRLSTRYPFGTFNQDKSRMDLSRMKVLKSIICSAEYFFPTHDAYSLRLGLYKLLPASLEELTLVFDQENNLVSQYGLESGQNSEERSWLVELATQKACAGYTPCLKKIHLIDWNRNFPFVEESDIRKFPASVLVDSLQAADIDLKISIRHIRFRDQETWTNSQDTFREPSSAQLSVRNVEWHLKQLARDF